MIEGGLEGLVFDKETLTWVQLAMRIAQRGFEPLLALPDIRGAGIVGPVGEPQRDIATAQAASDFNAVLYVFEGVSPDGGVRIAEGAVLILLILKEVRVDGTGFHTKTLGQLLNLIGAVYSGRKIPQNVQGDGGTNSGEEVHLTGVTEFLLCSCSRAGLNKLSKASAGIGEAPRRDFDAKAI
jgi:hypothetical protein